MLYISFGYMQYTVWYVSYAHFIFLKNIHRRIVKYTPFFSSSSFSSFIRFVLCVSMCVCVLCCVCLFRERFHLFADFNLLANDLCCCFKLGCVGISSEKMAAAKPTIDLFTLCAGDWMLPSIRWLWPMKNICFEENKSSRKMYNVNGEKKSGHVASEWLAHKGAESLHQYFEAPSGPDRRDAHLQIDERRVSMIRCGPQNASKWCTKAISFDVETIAVERKHLSETFLFVIVNFGLCEWFAATWACCLPSYASSLARTNWIHTLTQRHTEAHRGVQHDYE